MKTTINIFKENKCFCLKEQKIINIKDCNMFSCRKMKSCMKKTNADLNKEVNK